jgi:hypothetical protein
MDFVKRYGWHIMYFDKQLSASPIKGRRKVEVIVSNYELSMIPKSNDFSQICN